MAKVTKILRGIQQTLNVLSQAGILKSPKNSGLNPELSDLENVSGTQEKLLLGVSLIIFSLDDLGLLHLEDLVKEAKQLRAAVSKVDVRPPPPVASKV